MNQVIGLITVTMLIGTLAMGKDSPDQKRQKTRKMADQTLSDLYQLQPSAQGAIRNSTGYAVFDNMGANVLLLSTARGSRVAVNSKTKQETFMKMVSGGAGLGLGVKDYRVCLFLRMMLRLSDFSIPDGQLQRKRTLQLKQVNRERLTPVRLRRRPGFGSTNYKRLSSSAVDLARYEILQGQ